MKDEKVGRGQRVESRKLRAESSQQQSVGKLPTLAWFLIPALNSTWVKADRGFTV
jgi:hypothetical protein